jgi:sec-independent protein translocase protein TatA
MTRLFLAVSQKYTVCMIVKSKKRTKVAYIKLISTPDEASNERMCVMPFLPKGFEWIIILIVVLLIFGPKNLPKLGSALGRTVKNLRKGMDEGDEETAKEDTVVEELPQEETPKKRVVKTVEVEEEEEEQQA